MKRNKTSASLSTQMKTRASKPAKEAEEFDGTTAKMISTGSTLLDLAITGGRVRGGGMPGGILVEVFGPSGSGKTVLLCELAGAMQRRGGQVMFNDPEARLNKQFARQFDLDTTEIDYSTPDTVPQVFSAVRKWEPEPKNEIHGVFADSLAALSTGLEMDNDEGDKMGMRRAKEFSEELRKTCRIITQKNLLMVCSNQIRQNAGAGQFEPKYKSPGGEATGFYASLRLRTYQPEKIWKELTVAGKKTKRVIGVRTQVEVFKSTIWKPYRTAPLTILFDYGVDDVRQNLQFIKDYTKATIYTIGSFSDLDKSMDKSIEIVETEGWEDKLRETVIDLWEEIEGKFDSNRKTKQR